MEIIESHTSPDGLLTFLVCRDGPDVSLGFEGYPWHTHPDVLAVEYGLPKEDALKLFVRQLLGSQRIIAVAQVADQIRDVWVTDDVKKEMRYKPPEETIQFRYWEGRPWEPD